MKVKEFMEKLRQLDQEKNIWVFYDPPYACWEPDPTVVEPFYERMYPNQVKEGDYAIICG